MIVTGESVSGIGTRLYTPELGLTFDIGSCPAPAIGTASTVCITHGHMDHVGQAAYLSAVRSMQGMSAPMFLIPAHMTETFEQMFNAFEALNISDIPKNVGSIGKNQLFYLKRGLAVQAFKGTHSIDSFSYGVWQEKKRLKPQYVGMAGEVLGSLRKSGVEIEDRINTLVFVYTGDTTGEIFDLHPVLLTAETLAMEMTFFQDYPRDQAKKHGHTHIEEVIERSDRFQNKEIVLVHHSARYSEADKNRALASLPENFRNRSRWL